jgi:hypothetical protein
MKVIATVNGVAQAPVEFKSTVLGCVGTPTISKSSPLGSADFIVAGGNSA